MEPMLRKEVQDYMRVCERLIGFVRQYDGLMTNDEIEGILYYAEALEHEVLPFCLKDRHRAPRSH
jgi:hypothetical protein